MLNRRTNNCEGCNFYPNHVECNSCYKWDKHTDKNGRKKNKNWHKTFMKITSLISEHSTCAKIQVGAIIVRENRIISLGYNGVPSEQKHCYDIFKEKIEKYQYVEEFNQEHRKFQLANEIHAEINAILFAAKNGVSTNESIIYTTWSPCNDCAKAILQAGIKEVYYCNEYKEKEGINFLINNYIICEQIKL